MWRLFLLRIQKLEMIASIIDEVGKDDLLRWKNQTVGLSKEIVKVAIRSRLCFSLLVTNTEKWKQWWKTYIIIMTKISNIHDLLPLRIKS